MKNMQAGLSLDSENSDELAITTKSWYLVNHKNHPTSIIKVFCHFVWVFNCIVK